MKTKPHVTKNPTDQMKKLKKKSENTLRQMKIKKTILQNLPNTAKAVYTNTGLSQEIKKSPMNNPNYHLKELEKRRTSKTQISRKNAITN